MGIAWKIFGPWELSETGGEGVLIAFVEIGHQMDGAANGTDGDSLALAKAGDIPKVLGDCQIPVNTCGGKRLVLVGKLIFKSLYANGALPGGERIGS